MAFISGPDGDLKTAFVSDAWLLDQFVGNTLFAWGSNSFGGVGDNTGINRSNPVQTVAGGINWKSVACGYTHTAAIKQDGTLWCWGYNAHGQLGDNTVTDRLSPVQTVAFGTNWKQVSGGGNATAAIKTDGTLWCWGFNFYGQLGNNTTTHRSSPVQTVAFGVNWKQVSCGYPNTAAIKTDGTLWVWGNNGLFAVGDNSATHRSSPVQTVAFGTNWKQVSCGSHGTAAIKTDGTLWCWGFNNNGQLGDNTTAGRASPIQTVTGGTNWKQVVSGVYGKVAIKTDGTLWCWGRNDYGQLGDNTTASKSSPSQTVAFGTNWKQVSFYNNCAAIKTDGSIWNWGRNDYGQLGDNTTANKSSPVQTSTYGNNWKQVACGYFQTAAVTNGDI